ncbi:EF hand family protein [Trichomonas vaginalis G3]|uniref:EF hand family protein n=1 Tax=Trichomonas vaginalis (strain ATCC PRA-98 / G3) TaxID=412133 RepID=A2DN02_TRIV3|nr:calcium ion binding [Trichomonas vaginalis G3]EAY18179.1 EF hand family protein [Trichomonas vaginalis G3]KAI5491475.1 calcium ion binding [Trichomonas vaginalis G3]|eukprot:XP_001579165.1 EF hand family protein [Trichomonas vaginalis G3]
MGNHQSQAKPPTKDEIAKLSASTHFSPEEIMKLYSSFKEVSATTTADGNIDVNEFALMLGINNIQFAGKIFSAFDENPDQLLDFHEYVKGLSMASQRATLEEKASFVFNVYDADRSGKISRQELTDVMTLSLSENNGVKISPTSLNRIITATIQSMDENGDGEISLAEFITTARKNPAILNCVSIDIDHLLKY